jgi:esterase FrsA
MKIIRKILATTIFAVSCGTTALANEVWDAWGVEASLGFKELGVPEEEVKRIFDNMDELDLFATGPGAWSYELKQAGDVYYRRAQELELKGQKNKIIKAYTIAHEYYNSARFPQLFTAERREAYQRSLETYKKILKHRKIPMQEIRIPFEGKEVVGHFYNTQTGPAPVIIWSGGTDGWKMAGLEFKLRLMDEGFAIFAMDMPGTGESQHKTTYNSDRVYKHVVKYLQTRDDIDRDKIALYFGSFSGHFAAHLALTDENIAAAVNHSGGIHYMFTQYREMGMKELPPVSTSPGMRAAAAMWGMGLDPRDYVGRIDVALDELENFSLLDQGLLDVKVPKAPLMNIYGTLDRLMPIRDWELLKSKGIESEDLIYEGDYHMAWEHASDHRSKMISWLKKQLKMDD